MSALPTSCLPLSETETLSERQAPHESSESVVVASIEAEASAHADIHPPAQTLLIVPPALRVPQQPDLIVRAEATDEIPADEVTVEDKAGLVVQEREGDDRAVAAAPRVAGADFVMAPRYRLAELKRERRRVADMQVVLQNLLTFLTQEAVRNRARQRRQRIVSAAAGLAGLVLLVGVWTIARHTHERPVVPTQAAAPGPGREATCLGASCGTLDISMFGAAAVDPAKSAGAPASPPVLALMDAETGEGDRAASDVTAADARPPSTPAHTARVAILETLSSLANGGMLAVRETVDILTPQDWAEPIYPNLASAPAAPRADSVEVAAIEVAETDATEAVGACSNATCPQISEVPLGTVMPPSRGMPEELAAALPPPSLVAEDGPDMDTDFADASVTDVESVQSLAVRGLIPGLAPDHAPLAVALAPPSVPAEDTPPTDVDFADVDSVQSLAVRGLVADLDPTPALTVQPTLRDTEAASPVSTDLTLSSEAGLVLARTLDIDPRAAAGREPPPRATVPRRRPPSLSLPATVRHPAAKAARAKRPRSKARSVRKPAAPVAVIQPRGLFQFEPSKTSSGASAVRATPASKPLRKGAKAPEPKS